MKAKPAVIMRDFLGRYIKNETHQVLKCRPEASPNINNRTRTDSDASANTTNNLIIVNSYI